MRQVAISDDDHVTESHERVVLRAEICALTELASLLLDVREAIGASSHGVSIRPTARGCDGTAYVGGLHWHASGPSSDSVACLLLWRLQDFAGGHA